MGTLSRSDACTCHGIGQIGSAGLTNALNQNRMTSMKLPPPTIMPARAAIFAVTAQERAAFGADAGSLCSEVEPDYRVARMRVNRHGLGPACLIDRTPSYAEVAFAAETGASANLGCRTGATGPVGNLKERTLV